MNMLTLAAAREEGEADEAVGPPPFAVVVVIGLVAVVLVGKEDDDVCCPGVELGIMPGLGVPTPPKEPLPWEN